MLKNNLKKEDLVKNLSLHTGYSLTYSKKIIDDLIEILILVIKNDYLNLKNVGSFKLIRKRKRLGRNPKTKEEFIISARKSVSFNASKEITDKLNG